MKRIAPSDIEQIAQAPKLLKKPVVIWRSLVEAQTMLTVNEAHGLLRRFVEECRDRPPSIGLMDEARDFLVGLAEMTAPSPKLAMVETPVFGPDGKQVS